MQDSNISNNFKANIVVDDDQALKNINQQILLLTTKQESIISELQEEIAKTVCEKKLQDVEKLMCLVQKEKERLEVIKKRMNAMHKKSTSLKVEAAKIQYHQQQIRERDIENRAKEISLIRRPPNNSSDGT